MGFFLFLCYFLICDDFNENFRNLQDRLIQLTGTFGIFFRIFCSHLSRGTRFFAGKMWSWQFWRYEPRDSGPPRAQNSNFNNSFDRSKWEEHFEFFPKSLFHSLLQKKFLKFRKRDLSVRKCHKKRDFRPVNASIASCNDSTVSNYTNLFNVSNTSGSSAETKEKTTRTSLYVVCSFVFEKEHDVFKTSRFCVISNCAELLFFKYLFIIHFMRTDKWCEVTSAQSTVVPIQNDTIHQFT